MIRAVQSAADKAAFARCAAPWPALHAVLGRDLALWAGNPGAPVKLFCLTDAGGTVTAALDLYGRTALLAGRVGESEAAELAAFLHFTGTPKLRTAAALPANPGWQPREPLHGYEWAGGAVLPPPAGTVLDEDPPTGELAELLFPDDEAGRDAYYVTTNVARSHGLGKVWLLRGAGGKPLSTVAATLYEGEAYLQMGYTVPTARRQGYFAPLITHVAGALAGAGCRVTLDCAEALCPLYEALGFTQFGILRQYNTNCIN